MKRLALAAATITLLAGAVIYSQPYNAAAQTLQQSESVGVEGAIPTKAPSQAPTITTPTNGQTFSTLPITVAGLCQSNLLIEVFKNGVFSGAVQCANGSFSMSIDLFSGRNDLIARAYDALNQASPDSNRVTVTFNGSLPGGASRVSLTTAYAKRGAPPGETLTWPVTLSGGSPPYAISVDWGDKSAPDLISRDAAGNILLKHVYNQAGIYNITIKATDTNGTAAFLQVVGIGNGPILQTPAGAAGTTGGPTTPDNRLLIALLIAAILAMITTFWLGERHRLQVIRARLRKGLRPF